MNSRLALKLKKAGLAPTLKGRITRPEVGADDPRFVYVKSYNTDLSETFRKAREKMNIKPKGEQNA